MLEILTLPLQAHKVINMIMINGFEKYNKWMLTYFFVIGDTKIGKWHIVFVVFLALFLLFLFFLWLKNYFLFIH